MQEVLRDSWFTAREGTLCAREQARAWALRERNERTTKSGTEQTDQGPARAWEETREALAQRLKAIVRDINAKYDIDSLCRKYPERLQLIVDGKGKQLRT